MSQDTEHYLNVLRFWRAIETFNLPDVPATKPDDGKYYVRLEPGDDLPWDNQYVGPSEDLQLKHTLYFHCFPKQWVTESLMRLAPDPSDEFQEPQLGTTCLASLVIDGQGQVLERTYVRSAFLYGLRILETRGNPETLEDLLKKAYSEFILRFQLETESPQVKSKIATGSGDDSDELDDPEATPAGTPRVSWEHLQKELDDLRALAGEALPPKESICCVTEEVSSRVSPEASFMNTFYLSSLNYLISHPQDLGLPLQSILRETIDERERSDLLQPSAMLRCLNPWFMSPGRWPSNPNYGLYTAQHAALIVTFYKLRYQSGIEGINGPPGTGKTTLLREVIADVVVQRAKRLLQKDVSKLFIPQRHPIADFAAYYDVDTEVFSGDGILVTSNNNAAVENISRELPTLKSIDPDTFPDASYFQPIARNLDTKNPCWGLISAVLGRAQKRQEFVNDFWFAKGKGFDAYLKNQYDLQDPGKTREHLRQYDKIAAELKELLDEFDRFQVVALEYHTILIKQINGENVGASEVRRFKELATVLENDYKIPPGNLPSLNYNEQPMEDIHRATPYSSPELNTLRSNIFISSLELIECAVLVNAKYFRSNLNAFMDLLRGKLYSLVGENLTATLWNTFFFCVPVVSTTLASLERLFSNMGRGSIGWLLLDEAGQATPPSVCGAIWRSHRAVIIGDTLQIPPVVTIPEGLGKFLQESYHLLEPHWSPLHSSAQLLADRITDFGTYVNVPGGEVWTGIPLRAHRRCEDPMFTLSNRIAYNGQMVKVTANANQDVGRVPSCWYDVKGTKLVSGNVVLADIQALFEIAGMVKNMLGGEMFAISPFRSVSDYCKTFFRGKREIDKLSFGTIHTFQGKEADVVFMVLGMNPSNAGARAWASAAPNLLNVAVTRAKKRFYVIGDCDLWSAHSYFDQLAGLLPRKPHEPRDLF